MFASIILNFAFKISVKNQHCAIASMQHYNASTVGEKVINTAVDVDLYRASRVTCTALSLILEQKTMNFYTYNFFVIFFLFFSLFFYPSV